MGAAQPKDDTLAKGEFARECGVTPGRVSQWISEGKIGPDALDGEGRNARVRVSVAKAQLRRHLDIGQRFGNGLDTNLDDAPPSPAPANEGRVYTRTSESDVDLTVATRDPVAEDIKRERLRSIQLKNRAAAAEELAARGTYMIAADAHAAMAGVASSIVTVFESGCVDIASAIAAKFELDQRQVLHLVRAEIRSLRVKAAEQARRKAAGQPQLVADQVDDAVLSETDDGGGEA